MNAAAPPRPPRFDRDEVVDRLDLHAVAQELRLDIDQRKSRPRIRDYWASCPFHAENTASFHIEARRGFFYCFGCHAKGNGIDLIMQIENLDFPAALARAAGIAGVGPRVEEGPEAAKAREKRAAERDAETRRKRDQASRDAVRARSIARRWWHAAKPDPLVATYLAARGIDLDLVGGVPPTLRLFWQQFDPDDPSAPLVPVMIAPFQDAAGELTGAHRTFLAADGRGKHSAERSAKRMFADAWGHAIRLAPAAPTLGIAEGIETALGWMCWQAAEGRPCGAWAAGSSGNIAHALRLPAGIREVVLIGDNDPKSKANVEAELAAAERRLRAEGRRVSRDMPPRGMDFLDFWNANKSKLRG